jgi:dienelactone hydrolase
MAVGTAIRHLTDGGETESRREAMVQIWYPAEAAPGAKPARYFVDRRAKPGLRHWNLALLRTHAVVVDAPVSADEQTWPVLIYSPSWHGQANQNTCLAQELASHGFVVVGIDHPYSSLRTVFPDGRIARAVPTPFLDFSSDESMRRCFRRNERLLENRVEDVALIVRHLDQLPGRADVERMGVFGFSFGGAVAAECCRRDSRFRAGINMAGTMFGSSAEEGIERPFLFLDDGTEPPTQEELISPDPAKRRYARLLERDLMLERRSMLRYGGCRIRVRGAGHSSFSDGPRLAALPRLSGEGSLAPERTAEIVAAYVRAFFEEHLKAIAQQLLADVSPLYPEVELEVHARPSASIAGASA